MLRPWAFQIAISRRSRRRFYLQMSIAIIEKFAAALGPRSAPAGYAQLAKAGHQL